MLLQRFIFALLLAIAILRGGSALDRESKDSLAHAIALSLIPLLILAFLCLFKVTSRLSSTFIKALLFRVQDIWFLLTCSLSVIAQFVLLRLVGQAHLSMGWYTPIPAIVLVLAWDLKWVVEAARTLTFRS